MTSPAEPRPEAALGGRVLRGVLASSGGTLASQGLTLVAYLVLARLVTPADFGTVAAGTVVVGAGLLIAESGINAAIVHRKDGIEAAAATGLLASIAGGLLLTAGAAAAAPLVGRLFDGRDTAAIAAAASALILLRAAAVVPDALLRRRLSWARRTVIDPASAVAFAAVSLPACAAGGGAWGILAGYYASALTALALTWALARWRPRLRAARLSTWRELAGYGRHVVATEALYRVGTETDALVIGHALGTGPLGQFRYASRVAMRPFTAFSDTVSFVLFPALSRIASDRERFDAALERALRLSSVVVLPATLLLLPLGEPVVVLVLGPQWHTAGTVLGALCGFAAGQALLSMAGEAFKASGRPRYFARAQAIATIAGLVLAVALSGLGLVAIAVGFSAAALIAATYALVVLQRLSSARIAAQVLPPLASACAMALALLVLDRLVIQPVDHGQVAGVLLVAFEALAGLGLYALAMGGAAPGVRREARDLVRQARGVPVGA